MSDLVASQLRPCGMSGPVIKGAKLVRRLSTKASGRKRVGRPRVTAGKSKLSPWPKCEHGLPRDKCGKCDIMSEIK